MPSQSAELPPPPSQQHLPTNICLPKKIASCPRRIISLKSALQDPQDPTTKPEMLDPRSIKIPDLGSCGSWIPDLFGTLAQPWLQHCRTSELETHAFILSQTKPRYHKRNIMYKPCKINYIRSKHNTNVPTQCSPHHCTQAQKRDASKTRVGMSHRG